MEIKNIKNKSPFRIGVIGGMGPMAGVYLQQLIIDATPTKRDQDHIQVVCFTNSHIPDRTESLRLDQGKEYVKVVIETAKCLEKCEVSVLVMPCNTAHAKLSEIESALSTPILDMVMTAANFISDFTTQQSKVGIIATDGTVSSNVYQRAFDSLGIKYVLPDVFHQTKAMDVIYKTKARFDLGNVATILSIVEHLQSQGASSILLGCTELSLYFNDLSKSVSVPLFDPLRILADTLVHQAKMYALSNYNSLEYIKNLESQ